MQYGGKQGGEEEATNHYINMLMIKKKAHNPKPHQTAYNV